MLPSWFAPMPTGNLAEPPKKSDIPSNVIKGIILGRERKMIMYRFRLQMLDALRFMECSQTDIHAKI